MRARTRLARLGGALLAAVACDGGAGGPAAPGAGHFHPTTNVALEGVRAFRSVTIPEGVTVTATAELRLEVDGEVRVLGVLEGACVGLSVAAGGAVVVEGRISNACPGAVGSGPGLSLVADGDVTIRGATVESGGPVTIADVPGLSEGAFPAAPRHAGRTLRLENALLRAAPGRAADGADGAAGADGAGWTILAGDALVIAGPTTIAPQHGGHGGAAVRAGSESQVEARGGAGGAPGRLVLAAAGEVRLEPPLPGEGMVPARAVPILDLARGGNGGRAEVRGTGPSGAAARDAYVARGGPGGSAAGAFRVVAPVFAILAPRDVSPIRLRVPPPALGGSARVLAPGGADATAAEAARPGPAVVAEVGAPGAPVDLCPGPAAGACAPAAAELFRVWLNHVGGEPGPEAAVEVGPGGAGAAERPDGAAGPDVVTGGPPWLRWNGSHDSTAPLLDAAIDGFDPGVVAAALPALRLDGSARGGDGFDRCGAPGGAGAGGPGGRLVVRVPLAGLREALGAVALDPILRGLAPVGAAAATVPAAFLQGGDGGDGAPAGTPGPAGVVEAATDLEDAGATPLLEAIEAVLRDRAAPVPGRPGAVC